MTDYARWAAVFTLVAFVYLTADHIRPTVEAVKVSREAKARADSSKEHADSVLGPEPLRPPRMRLLTDSMYYVWTPGFGWIVTSVLPGGER